MLRERFKRFKARPAVTFITSNRKLIDRLPDCIGVIAFKNSTARRYSDISEYFQEQVRIDAKRYDQKASPSQFWEQHHADLSGASPQKQRLLVSKAVKECTHFCPLILVQIVKMYKSKRILDFCSGWGDRLVGACLCDDFIQEYTGIDPNKRLFTGYKNIIKHFVPKHSASKYTMVQGCAEDIVPHLRDGDYDLVITSPPYFDLEAYSADKDQSIVRYPSFDRWYSRFLLASIQHSIRKLRKHGVVAININNYEAHDIMSRLVRDVKGATFMGKVYFGNHRCRTSIFQPILMWQKND